MTEEVELMTWSYLSQLSQVSYNKIVNLKKEMEPKEEVEFNLGLMQEYDKFPEIVCQASRVF